MTLSVGWSAADVVNAPHPCGEDTQEPRLDGEDQTSRGFVHRFRFWLAFRDAHTLSDGWCSDRAPGSCLKMTSAELGMVDSAASWKRRRPASRACSARRGPTSRLVASATRQPGHRDVRQTRSPPLRRGSASRRNQPAPQPSKANWGVQIRSGLWADSFPFQGLPMSGRSRLPIQAMALKNLGQPVTAHVMVES